MQTLTPMRNTSEMALRPQSSKPTPPAVMSGQTEVEVPFVSPITQDTVIGHMPHDRYVSREGLFGIINAFSTVNADKPIYRHQPVMGPNGKPVYEMATATVDLKPYSKTQRGLLGGLIGSGALGLVGAGIALAAGIAVAPIAIGAAVVGVAVGAVIGKRSVEGDTVSIDYEKKPVVEHRFDGYHISQSERYSPRTQQNGETKNVVVGTDFSYWSNVSEHQVGQEYYWQPYARHSSDHD